MPVCRIMGMATPSMHLPGGTHATFYCQTHDIEMGRVTKNGERCSIGKIEDATDAAMMRIAEAVAKVRA